MGGAPNWPHREQSWAFRAAFEKLFWLRCAAVVLMAGFTLAVSGLLADALPQQQKLWGVVFLMLGAALYTLFALKVGRAPVFPRPFFGHLCFDVVLWGMFFFATGGITNPLIAMWLPFVGIAAATLPARWAVFLTMFIVTGYALLWRFYWPLHVIDATWAQYWHLAGMGLSFALAAGVMAWFGVRFAAQLKAGALALAQERAARARDERIVALGNQAAHTAHKLGTPLNTLRILVDSWAAHSPLPDGMGASLTLMQQQIETCKTLLNTLVRPVQDPGSARDLRSWLDETLSQWHSMRPNAVATYQTDAGCEHLSLLLGDALQEALLNLLNNAADAQARTGNSDMPVSIHVRCTTTDLEIVVHDRGDGISPSVQAAFIQGPIPNAYGMGMGLFLAHATITRFGGALRFQAQSPGTSVSLTLPLSVLRA